MVRLCLLVGVAAASATSRAGVDAGWGGLSAYFADPTAHFWKSCGQNGGNGAGGHFGSSKKSKKMAKEMLLKIKIREVKKLKLKNYQTPWKLEMLPGY